MGPPLQETTWQIIISLYVMRMFGVYSRSNEHVHVYYSLHSVAGVHKAGG